MRITYKDTHGTRIMELNEYEAKKWASLNIQNPTIEDVSSFFDFQKGNYKGTMFNIGRIIYDNNNGGLQEMYLPRRK